MERPLGRYARHSKDCTGIPDAAHVFGACVANTILASEVSSPKQAEHLIASDQVQNLLHPDKWGAVHICNLYSVLSTRAEIARMADAAFDYNGNAPPLAGVHPDRLGPVVLREADGRRVLKDLRWGMPSSSFAQGQAAKKRAEGLRKKGIPYDWEELLRMEPDRGTTNVRNTTSQTTGEINKHWGRWLGPESRCLAPFTSFAEPDQDFEKTRGNVWFALDDSRPLAFFAGVWTPHACVRAISKGWEEMEVYAFLTTDSAEPVKTYHDKAMPVILTKPEEWAEWMSDKPWPEVAHLQRPLPNALRVVAHGGKFDPAGANLQVGDLI